jgi:hypothetical protein
MKLFATAFILFFCSCKVSNINLLGRYDAKSYHRSTIILDSNNKFKFWNDGLEFLLSNENFLCTQGSWTRVRKKRLLLSSISDSIAIPRFSIAKQKLNSSSKSKFVFLDLNKDTVLMYTIYKNNDIIFYRSHGPFLTNFEGSLANSDTLTFTFTYGFKPVQILIDDDEPIEYIVTLNREFRPNYFHNTEFIIRRKKLIRVTDKAKFRKTKSNGI